MITDGIGLYIHVPYCIRKCKYCDFCSLQGCGSVPDDYIDALLKEADSYSDKAPIKVSTVYFGGGTPSLLHPDQLSRIMDSLSKVFDFSFVEEFTVEANPGTVSFEKLAGYKKAGVNRISLGLQSFHDNELKLLGRIHTSNDFIKTYFMCREAGFENVSIDLMYGIPDQTIQSFNQTLRQAVELRPEHISVYGLIVEEGTPFYEARETLNLPTEDDEVRMYEAACALLSENGYSHYEISNYSLAGMESKHNLKYWRNQNYIGLGAAAHSYFCGMRYGNLPDVHRYILEGAIRTEEEIVDKETEQFEYGMMGLRLREGISLSEYEALFGKNFLSENEAKIKSFVQNGLVVVEDGRIFLTDRGFYLSNTVMSELL